MIRRILVFVVRVYQLLSPLKMLLPAPPMGRCCRFHPTCSEYACQAINSLGPARGLWLTMKRLARCHPFAEGGVDPVPKR